MNHFYQEHHKLIEKYHISGGTPREGGGGEYPLQDGFGWTNGVVRRLIGLYGEP
ncbi:cytoplasmic trehalase [Salmonella enterica subsp. enterica serovar Alachua str. R6-377]|uniref:Cytoplasmic trehalase n=3 Tax=Salmonella enterica I TaxID=59201 RepID=G5R6X5_SALSE|nr:cytoplasmic trehalase [Salmonella enterica subsp. enterica serovar Alachua str. R6-377]EHC58414.1 cytoplasmic trehalase [Salmonella enterica subsp. enterica serovar Johannesburg str. S5-703]EHC60868.1 cytoplasmic trehalase [Salmonella enterica subsp. enterica serovar Minnesota str. A4-603]EHC66219.1 cytoplasmic trehalase [Salmonella enterica subsp. enterica serovar Mississippi str. A4-633]EHC74077.1 cytoplasmic trehalase [Salmonella enterica subsp. enterica serovar Montevideo str. S5-403]EH